MTTLSGLGPSRFPINNWGADTLDCPNTQALLQYGIPGFCPEFNMGLGADGRWKTREDNKSLGVDLLRGLRRWKLVQKHRRQFILRFFLQPLD